MNRSSSGAKNEARIATELLLEVDLRRGRLRRSLREALRGATQDGRLPAGTRLPSSRRLATDLGVSRGVVADVYDQLVSEGYLEVRPRSGPTVAVVAAAAPPDREPDRPMPRFDFIATIPDVSLFPRRTWAREMERAVTRAPDAALGYADQRGVPALREALASYLARVRGVRVDPGRIVVTQGYAQALDLLSRALAGRGATTVAVETPSIPNGWATIGASGLRVVGCPVDGDGLQVGALEGLRPQAVVATPAHQFPTGAVLAPRRRSALVEWAQRHDALVVEDDYDAEFRYDRMPVGAVQGLDPGRVAHVGTASKTLAPALRLAWISLPAHLVDDVRARKTATDSGSPSLDQLALAGLLNGGEYERHVARMRHVYRRRRDRLMRALATTLPRLQVRGAAAGIHVLLALDPAVDDVAIARAASARGIRVRPLSPLHLDQKPARGLLLGYARLVEDQIEEAVTRLAAVLAEGGVRT